MFCRNQTARATIARCSALEMEIRRGKFRQSVFMETPQNEAAHSISKRGADILKKCKNFPSSMLAERQAPVNNGESFNTGAQTGAHAFGFKRRVLLVPGKKPC